MYSNYTAENMLFPLLSCPKRLKSETYPGIESSGVAGVTITLALWIRAAVKSNAGATGKLVAGGAQRRVREGRPRFQTSGQ